MLDNSIYVEAFNAFKYNVKSKGNMGNKKIIIAVTIVIILVLSAAAFLIFNSPNDVSLPQKTCDSECDKYRYNSCPEGCIPTCTPSSCSNDICTQDCDGPGSCAYP